MTGCWLTHNHDVYKLLCVFVCSVDCLFASSPFLFVCFIISLLYFALLYFALLCFACLFLSLFACVQGSISQSSQQLDVLFCNSNIPIGFCWGFLWGGRRLDCYWVGFRL